MRISLRIDEQTGRLVQRLAFIHKRSVNKEVAFALSEYVEKFPMMSSGLLVERETSSKVKKEKD